MSVFYDANGFAHETEKRNYGKNGFPAPLFNFANNLISDDFVKIVNNWFSTRPQREIGMEEYIEKTAWDEFTEPPGEVYVMIGMG